MSNNSDTEIGVATIEFNENGKAITAEFAPTILYKAQQKILNNFLLADGKSGENGVIEAGKTLLAGWFNTVDEIELADREQYEIAGEILDCETYNSGTIKHCKVRFYFKQIDNGKVHK